MVNNPFNYSHSRHTRRYTPEHKNDYSKYKPTLQLEYDRKCIYCLFPDTIKGCDGFGVDHYRPKSLFPLLITEYSNLFYCCNTCNRWKGNKWPTGVFIPNPDEHIMIDHLRFKKEIVDPVTNEGKYTCELLQLNDPNLVRTRRALITSLHALERDLDDLAKLEKAIRKEFNKGNITESERDLDLAEVERDRQERISAINVIAGRN